MAVVGVVVVTYRSAERIESCLRSLRAASAAHDVRIVVLDNASDDDSLARAEAADPVATVIDRGANDGYGVACNDGLRRLGEAIDWVLFANPDTVWPPGSLDELVDAAEHHRGAGLVSPALVGEDGAPQAFVERDLTLGLVLRGMTRLGARVRPAAPPLSGPPIAVDWLHTAAALLPAAIARRIGGFDPRFFLFAEDADLCRRVRAIGLEVLVVPSIRVTHAGGASFAASGDVEHAAALRTHALARYLEKYQGRVARKVFGLVGALVYGAARHRGQAKAAWLEARR